MNNQIQNYYYGVILTLDKRKKDVSDKSDIILKERILKWVLNIKNIDDILYSGPFLDIGENNNNMHANITIKTNIKDIDEVQEKYFKTWSRRKGYIHNMKVYSFKGWLNYAKRNHEKLVNNPQDEYPTTTNTE
jgi:hypothetical protein